MIQEFSQDVKEFFLSYIKIQQLTSMAQGEVNNVNASLEAEIAKQEWFSLQFEIARNWRLVQVWKKKWHPSETQGCPWIHFEHNFSWADLWVQVSLDLESIKIVPQDTILKIASVLSGLLSDGQHDLFKASGWILKPKLEGNRMLLFKRENVDLKSFSAEWLFTTGKRLFNELSKVIPDVDRAIEDVLG